MKLRHDLVRFRTLGREEQRVLLLAAACMPLFWIGLRVLGLPRFHAWLRRTRALPSPELTREQICAMGRLVNLAAQKTLGSTSCLTRSLLLEWLLRRRGVKGQLRIGVRLDRGTLAAHAWIEVDAVPVNDKPDVSADFQPFGDPTPAQSFQAR